MKEDYEILLRALLMEREKLLNSCTELKKFQEEIDAQLDVEDPFLRAKKLNELLLRKLNDELIPAMYHLRKLQSKINNMTVEELKNITIDKKSA